MFLSSKNDNLKNHTIIQTFCPELICGDLILWVWEDKSQLFLLWKFRHWMWYGYFFLAGSAGPAFYVMPARNKMTKLIRRNELWAPGAMEEGASWNGLWWETHKGTSYLILHCLKTGNFWRAVLGATSDFLKQWLQQCSKFWFLHTVQR